MSKTRKIIAALVVVLVLAAVIVYAQNKKAHSPASQQRSQDQQSAQQQLQDANAKTISYQGVDGKNALDLLKQAHQVQTKSYSGLGEMVIAIDGIEPDPAKQFWSFYVNGNEAQVGASSYTTKSTDTIEWKLVDINQTSN